jgi:hypothetical protein
MLPTIEAGMERLSVGEVGMVSAVIESWKAVSRDRERGMICCCVLSYLVVYFGRNILSFDAGLDDSPMIG